MCGEPRLTGLGAVRGYSFVECVSCGFAFTPALDEAVLADLYREGYHGIEEGAPEVGWADWSFLRPALDRFGTKALRILDFGAGNSQVPALLRELGHRVTAVDVTPPTRPDPDRLTGRLPDLRLPSGGFDLPTPFKCSSTCPSRGRTSTNCCG